jgi:oxaloacetate decarboxylase alpha subunit
MKIEEIKELIEAVSRNGITELEVEHSGVKVRIRKEARLAVPAPSTATAASWYQPEPSVAPEMIEASTVPAVAPAPSESSDLYIVRSPIVGTFYRAPNPNAEPFVMVGDQVEAGRVLCIVEAMKLMNEIESETSGEIVKIFVENGEPVEFGQSLFGLRSSGKG